MTKELKELIICLIALSFVIAWHEYEASPCLTKKDLGVHLERVCIHPPTQKETK